MTQTSHTGKRLDTAAAEQYTGLARQTLAKLRVYGGGPRYIKVGRRVIYDTRDLDDWLDSRKRNSTSDGGVGY